MIAGGDTQPSWQSRLCASGIRLLVRREQWGRDHELARRLRRILGAPRLYAALRTYGVSIRPSTHPQIRGEWIHPRDPTDRVILYVHGGGFVSCSAATHRPITCQLARSTGASVFALDYPLAPEHPCPAAPNAVAAAYRWLILDRVTPSRLAVAGDSAGGNLALGLLARARDASIPLPACGVALSPWLDLTGGSPSVQSNDGHCAMFRPRNMTDCAHTYLGGTQPADPVASPLLGDLSALPPVLLQVGSTELLRDDAVRAHEKIQAVGGESTLQVFDGMFHGWHMLDGIVPEARAAIREVATFLARHMGTGRR